MFDNHAPLVYEMEGNKDWWHLQHGVANLKDGRIVSHALDPSSENIKSPGMTRLGRVRAFKCLSNINSLQPNRRGQNQQTQFCKERRSLLRRYLVQNNIRKRVSQA